MFERPAVVEITGYVIGSVEVDIGGAVAAFGGGRISFWISLTVVLALTVANRTWLFEGLNDWYNIRRLWVNWGLRSGLPVVKLISSDVVVSGWSWLALVLPPPYNRCEGAGCC